MRALFCGLVAVGILVGCDSKSVDQAVPPGPPRSSAAEPAVAAQPAAPAPAKASATKSAYDIPERSEQELAGDLLAACLEAKAKGSPLLIEFSARWCGDCRRLAEMKKEPLLASALAKTPHYVVNIGHFDHHEKLLDAFSIKSIAKWKVVSSEECDKPVEGWRQLASRTLEPATGEKVVTTSDLVAWLEEKMSASPALK